MIMVTVLVAFVLLGISAFTIDLGQAYVSKRNLQKAADAGALAAAQELAQYPGTCETVLQNAEALENAEKAATDYREWNREEQYTDSRQLQYEPVCADGTIVVTLEVEGDTTSFLGPHMDADSEITTTRIAEAVVEVGPSSSTRMRPLAMCSTQLTAGPFVRLDYPKEAPPACGNASGAWWTVDCPGAASNSTSQMVQQVRDGCPNGVSVVDGQTSDQTTGELTNTLEAACLGGATPEGGCLESNPGNLDSGQVAASWKYLVDNSVKAVFPVFCAPPQCDSTTIDGSGNNATFPVYKLLGAVICGYHFSKTENYHSAKDECEGLPTDMYAGDDDDNNLENYLIIKYVQISASGSNQASDCDLGDTTGCDGGIRRTRLVE
ncbi:hypothetical protein ASG88_00690 [Nocardioides sp. Soil777]|uniref:pilus assembly protein TadG-related protein n=1 Tax=Nocardioides sp. Soil777 TaxID=1736409 RepID=UPI00070385A9|nr:pilus assembly protein TadG-related protein [Nocardioides sp. Soil777]KRF07401.1 hypothetical protein ASG88_00690 [Nocardioides sp. Soil777]